jgi:hypothetical protein
MSFLYTGGIQQITPAKKNEDGRSSTFCERTGLTVPS